jgi:hypothetical protein
MEVQLLWYTTRAIQDGCLEINTIWKNIWMTTIVTNDIHLAQPNVIVDVVHIAGIVV